MKILANLPGSVLRNAGLFEPLPPRFAFAGNGSPVGSASTYIEDSYTFLVF